MTVHELVHVVEAEGAILASYWNGAPTVRWRIAEGANAVTDGDDAMTMARAMESFILVVYVMD